MAVTWITQKNDYTKSAYIVLLAVSASYLTPLFYRLYNIITRNNGLVPLDIAVIWTFLILINVLTLIEFNLAIIIWMTTLFSLGVGLALTYETHFYQAAIGCVWIASSIILAFIKRRSS